MRDVRFTPKTGHAQRRYQCLLSAISGHSALCVLDEGLLAIEDEQEQVVSDFKSSRED